MFKILQNFSVSYGFCKLRSSLYGSIVQVFLSFLSMLCAFVKTFSLTITQIVYVILHSYPWEYSFSLMKSMLSLLSLTGIYQISDIQMFHSFCCLYLCLCLLNHTFCILTTSFSLILSNNFHEIKNMSANCAIH